MSRVRLQDVADAAGVSRSTVSKCLNGYASIPEATRLRILRVADELGYRPNPLVSALMAQRGARRREDESPVIAVFDLWPAPWATNVGYAPCREGLESEADELGFRIEYVRVDRPDDPATTGRIRGKLRMMGVRGIIVPQVPLDACRINMDWSGFCAVAIGPSLREPDLSRVMPDHYRAMQMRFRHVRERGHRRIGFAVPEEKDERMNRRYSSAFLGCQIDLGEEDRVPLLRYPDEGADAMVEWFERHRPDCVMTQSAEARQWLEDWARREEDAVPEIELGNDSVDIHFAEVGQAAVRLLVERMHQARYFPESVLEEVCVRPTLRGESSRPG